MEIQKPVRINTEYTEKGGVAEGKRTPDCESLYKTDDKGQRSNHILEMCRNSAKMMSPTLKLRMNKCSDKMLLIVLIIKKGFK